MWNLEKAVEQCWGSTSINPERANLSLVMETDSLG